MGTLPFKNCTNQHACWELFQNGKCDEICNTEACLYDGFDCEEKVEECNPFYDMYCSNHFANGHCDTGCDTAACAWDGLDCDHEKENLAKGELVVIIYKMTPEGFKNISTQFVRRMGMLLRATVKIKKDEYGNEMIYPWPNTIKRVKRYITDVFTSSRSKRSADPYG
jgi:Notch-like protein